MKILSKIQNFRLIFIEKLVKNSKNKFLINFEAQGYRKSDWQKLVWCRPDQIFKGKKYDVYGKENGKDSISADDILQGGLGDCYLLSAMAAIAEFSDRIKRCFLTRTTSKEGVYCVAMYINGVCEEVVMDDQFPCHARTKTVAFNSSADNELWVMLIEKAWAKVHGGFLNISAGLIREALHDLTGAPAITYFNDEGTREERWSIIYDAEQNDFIMCAGTTDLMGDGTDQQEEKTGIVGSHAYALIAAPGVSTSDQSARAWQRPRCGR